ncbi:hypothetical protein, partial [Mesorhizobium marinum]
MSQALREEISTFMSVREARHADARQLAALQIACHVDLAEALRADPSTRARIALRLQRLIE